MAQANLKITEQPSTQDPGVLRQKSLGYWAARNRMLYYQAVFQYAAVAGYDAETVIDIGCGGTDYINWLHWIPKKYMLDFKVRVPSPDVIPIETDFFQFEPPQRFDLALCCQVLEHIEDAAAFCRKLKDVCRHLIVSVPYKWIGNAPGHIHDPVDEEKLLGWMGVRPNNSQVVYEPFREGRLIAYYNVLEGPNFRFPKDHVMKAITERAG
jgi:SAM-dependent methyltransferase